MTFTPGSLVTARGRDWIVLAGSDAETLRLRPISGSEEDQAWIHVPLEAEPVTEAKFPLPDPQQRAGHDAALLLRDALVLSLRRGAGPFRGFGQISVVPRAYQLVPLLMALKLDPVRLLIADDVGIGKTIEAGIIARELVDRGDIDRTAVLCPPHLVDQWITELQAHFHMPAVAVTATSAARLERDLPQGASIFSAYPHTVVSLDYIKSDRRRDDFLRACPGFVIIDEAHTCTSTGQGRHQRYALLKGLAASKSRHMIFLTATPHSGDDAAYFGLLGLLDPEFERLAEATGEERTRLRDRLSHHFVQRRRIDIEDDGEKRPFPRRETKELTYRLAGEWDLFLDTVLDYCAQVAAPEQSAGAQKRPSFYTTLALLRCVASSPAAALQALRTHAGLDEPDEDMLADRVFDGRADALPDDDVEPPISADDPALAQLIAHAERLARQPGDPKLKVLSDHVGQLLDEGFNPVVFCRYIATAHYLGRHFEERLSGVEMRVVTGELTADQRREKVEELHEGERRLLIATDCLSEGINLQASFDAVVHYDLSWNPTRHEQREGRVDRFGQEKPVVRATLLYGANNPVDGTVLEVILRKAAKIREELGVPVPLPDDSRALTQTLMRAVVLRQRKASRQRVLDFGDSVEAHAVDAMWQDAAEKAKKNRTVFAQQRLKPRDVLPEWEKTMAAIGGQRDVHRFTDRALARLGAGLEAQRRGYRASLGLLPEDVRERLVVEGVPDSLRIDFEVPPAPRCQLVQRSHPLVAVLADTLLERTLASGAGDGDGTKDPAVLGRAGCWIAAGIEARTTVALLRLRHQLVTRRAGGTSTQLVEEATALAWTGITTPTLHEGPDALALLAPEPVGDPPPHVRIRAVTQAIEQLPARRVDLDTFAERRSQALLADHRRVREAADARGSYSVKALLPADVVGLFVLLPRVD